MLRFRIGLLTALPAAWLLLSQCGSSDVVSETGPEIAASAGAPAISGAVNAGSQGAGVFTRSAALLRTACTVVPASETCTGGVKKASYNDCLISTSKHKYSGSVQLTYLDTGGCSMDAQASTLTRILNITRTLNYPGAEIPVSTLQTTSDSHTDFEGNSWGGGSVITRTSPTTFQFVMPGIRKKRMIAGAEKATYDVTVHHLEPPTITTAGTLTSGTKTVSGGKIELIHNLAAYRAELVPTSLVYDKADCCHPSSGTIAITFTKRLSGVATLTFGGGLACGLAKFEYEGASKTVELHGCE